MGNECHGQDYPEKEYRIKRKGLKVNRKEHQNTESRQRKNVSRGDSEEPCKGMMMV